MSQLLRRRSAPGRVRVTILGTAVVLAGLAGAGAGVAGSTAVPETAAMQALDTRPNIVFITTDDMRVEDLRAMPNVKRLLIDQGMTFSTSYLPFPLCCPARAAWMTGQYNHNNGVMGNGGGGSPEPGYSALDTTSTVATWLEDAGYQTALVGKFLNGYGDVTPVVPPGWQEWRVQQGGANYMSTRLAEYNGGALTSRTYAGVYKTDLFDSIAAQVLTRRLPGTAPLFLWISHFAPHGGTPVEPDDPSIATPAVPDRWRDFYAAEPLLKDPSFNEADVTDKPSYVRNKALLSPSKQAELREANSQRLESLRAVDDSVAHIVRVLRASGELANTVLVFSSDNGNMMGEHRIPAGKVVPYEASSRVPLIIRGPGFRPGATRRAWVAAIDVAPTFADLADTAPGLDVDGRSLLPLASTPGSWAARTLVMESGPYTLAGTKSLTEDWYHGVRTNRYKYIRYNTGETELYDLQNDPDELVNLSGRSAYATAENTLSRLLTRMEDCAGAECR